MLLLAAQEPTPRVAGGETGKPGTAQGAVPIGKVLRGGDLPGSEISPELREQIKAGLEGLGKAMNAGRKQPGDLAQYHKKVVLVHVIDWREPSSSEDLIDLMREVGKANADREVQLIGIMPQGEKAAAKAREAGVDWPVGLTTLRNSPSPCVTPETQSRVFVIGRWSGRGLPQEVGQGGAGAREGHQQNGQERAATQGRA